MSRSMYARGGRSMRRPGLELLEGRTLLNASVDIGADGALVCRLDPGQSMAVEVWREGDVYVFQAPVPIDVTSNDAGLAVTGAGTSVVMVAGPSSLHIVTAWDDQEVVVRGTGVPTSIELGADRGAVFLGDDGAEGSGGLGALAGPIWVVAAAGSDANGLTVSDGDFAYDPTERLTYIVSATTVTAEGIDGFAGVSFSGLDALRLNGTTNRSAPSALYLVTGTPDGAATTIDATGGFGRDFSIVGTSSAPSGSLTLLSAGEANLWATYIGQPTVIAGGSRTSIWIEGARDSMHSLHSILLIEAAAGGVDLQFGPYWSAGAIRDGVAWDLVRGRDFDGVRSPYARLEADRGSGLVFFRPEQLRKLGIDDRGVADSLLRVDFSYGDPIPSDSSAWGGGLIYVGAAGAQPHGRFSMSLAGAGAGADALVEELHVAFPLYRGAIELTRADGSKRYISYQFAESTSDLALRDTLVVDSYRWTTDLYSSLDGTTLVDSELRLTAEKGMDRNFLTEWTLGFREANPGLRMASMDLAGKSRVQILRGWIPGLATTVLDYDVLSRGEWIAGEWNKPARLSTLSIENATPGGLSPQAVRLVNGLPGVATTVVQGRSDSATVSLAGVATSRSVVLSADGLAELVVDAAGVPVSASDVVSLNDGWRRIPATPASSAVAFKRYGIVRLRNTTEGDVVLPFDPVAGFLAPPQAEADPRKARPY